MKKTFYYIIRYYVVDLILTMMILTYKQELAPFSRYRVDLDLFASILKFYLDLFMQSTQNSFAVIASRFKQELAPFSRY